MSNVSVSNGNIKCPVGKSICAVNLPLKLFCATIADTDAGCLMSPHILFDTCLDHLLAKFESNCMIPNIQNVELFDKKIEFSKL